MVEVVDFLVVVLAGVFERDLVVDLAVVVRLAAVLDAVVDLLDVFGVDFVVLRGVALGAGSVAIASIRGAGFFGIAART